MAARDVLKNINLFVDGRGQAGQIQEINLPKLTLQTEDARLGGMDAPVKLTMGMEALETDFSVISYDRDILSSFGVVEGAFIPLTVRAALESFSGVVTPVTVNMRGKITEVDSGTWKAGEVPALKITMSLVYYKLQHGDRVIHEIDVENMVRSINGVDALEAIRQALGI